MKKILFLLFLSVIGLFGCGNKRSQKIEKELFSFGTYIKITVYDEDSKKAEKAIEAAFKEIERIDSKLNTKKTGSIIDQINSSKDKKIKLDSEGKEIFSKVEELYEVSNKKYDITISPLMDVWGFTTYESEKKLPSKKEIDKALSKIDYSKVSIKDDYLLFEKPVEKIDTGSFLKGYAISRAKLIMKDMGIKSAFITSISSIETIGTKPGSKKWRIGLQNPSDPTKILDVANLDDKAMGVSGDYQTFVEIDGKRYHHILDVKTGYPVSDKKMVVVICEDAFTADMLSTAFFSMPIKEILKYVEDKKNVDVFIVDADSKITTSTGFNYFLKK
ncbi:FAD:protein FMN transferase [Ilyobacter polytropus]|uniref:FAD:protein FMN transferase n=1 Tax=Ilyobacter polytropus (strain ATCC 51220 / DSM 2926 / LMG 16218 / CuHBu1) TaxID=572544 RepID=E3H878_ILYPC|nr:FAD:protein FMN transferase [Ilyobacter polytropus]ADO81974.1 ApbE family lipoprotein [Ilyobacter polytropus DSM 2926]